MSARTSLPFPRSARIALFLGLIAVPPVAAQGGGAPPGENAGTGRATWDVTQPRGKTRDIDFTTSEGTWMSADLSADRTWVVFDLLGHIYRMPAAGGEATVLTQNSGVALNFQPRISPDGKTIAFITDRRGQYNLWVMNADGSNPRAIFTDLNATALEPAWTPDGNFIVVKKRCGVAVATLARRRGHLDVPQGRRAGRPARRTACRWCRWWRRWRRTA